MKTTCVLQVMRGRLVVILDKYYRPHSAPTEWAYVKEGR